MTPLSFFLSLSLRLSFSPSLYLYLYLKMLHIILSLYLSISLSLSNFKIDLSLNKENIKPFFLGQIYQALKQTEKALSSLKTCYQLDTTQKDVLETIGQLLLQLPIDPGAFSTSTLFLRVTFLPARFLGLIRSLEANRIRDR